MSHKSDAELHVELMLEQWTSAPSEAGLVRMLKYVGRLMAAGHTEEAAMAAERITEVTGVSISLACEEGVAVTYSTEGRVFCPGNDTTH